LRISVLAWGSIIWDRGDLSIIEDFEPTGPSLPIEFCRVSRDGRFDPINIVGIDHVVLRAEMVLVTQDPLRSLDRSKCRSAAGLATPCYRLVGPGRGK
jgi:hypothetical protein